MMLRERSQIFVKAGLVFVVSLGLVFGPGLASAQVAEEKKMGEEFITEARRHFPLSRDWEMQSFVSDLGGRIVATLGDQPFKYEFNVVTASDLNAFAVPGGKIFVHSGLIARAESEDELAGVLGHEVAHSHAHHIVRQQQKAAPLNYASLLGVFLGMVHPVLGAGAMAAGQAAQLQYQRDFEREADFLGVRYAKKADFDPAAMMYLLKKIFAEQQLNPTLIPPYFMSHPLSGERLANLEAVLGGSEWDGEPPPPPTLRLLRARAIARGTSETREQVVPDYERMLAGSSEKERPLNLELIGVMMTHGEDWTLAEGHLEEAEANGRNVDRELGRVYLRRGNLAAARPRLERAVAANAGDWNALADLANLDYQEGAYDSSITRYEKANELYPWDAQLARDLGRAMGKANRDGAGFYWFARASEMQGDMLQALSFLERARKELPENDPLVPTVDAKIAELNAILEETPPSPFTQRRLVGSAPHRVQHP